MFGRMLAIGTLQRNIAVTVLSVVRLDFQLASLCSNSTFSAVNITLNQNWIFMLQAVNIHGTVVNRNK